MSASTPSPRTHVQFACAECGVILQARKRDGGGRARCSTCGALVTVPRIDPYTGLPDSAVSTPGGPRQHDVHAFATTGRGAPRIIQRPGGSCIVCPRCQTDSPVDAHVCRRCRMPFTVRGATDVGSPAAEAPAIASVVLGGMALAVLVCSPVVAAGLAVLALGCGVHAARRRPSRGYRRVIIGALTLAGLAVAGAVIRWILGV